MAPSLDEQREQRGRQRGDVMRLKPRDDQESKETQRNLYQEKADAAIGQHARQDHEWNAKHNREIKGNNRIQGRNCIAQALADTVNSRLQPQTSRIPVVKSLKLRV